MMIRHRDQAWGTTIVGLSHQKRIPELVARVLRVPDTARQFSENATDAHRLHRVNQTLLTQLLDHGLPHRGIGTDRRFDHLDLANIGLGLGMRSPRWLAMRWWSKSLTQIVPDHEIRYELRLSSPCPSSGHPGECRFHVHQRLVTAAHPGSFREMETGVYAFEVRLDSRRYLFDPPFTELVDRILPYHFHLLPHPLNADLGFACASGLADCRLATTLLQHLADTFDLRVRSTAGYFVAPPYATLHVWVEFEVDGQWIPADPFLLNALARWGIVDPHEWPPNRSPQGLLWRVHNRYIELMTHNEHDILLHPSMTVTGQRAIPLAGGAAPDPTTRT